MPYPALPPEPPAIVQTVSTVATDSTSAELESQPAIFYGETVVYQFEIPTTSDLAPQMNHSARLLGEAISLETTPVEDEQTASRAYYQFSKNSFFTHWQPEIALHPASILSGSIASPTVITQTPSEAENSDSNSDPNSTPQIPVILPGDTVEVTADQQEFDQTRQLVTAKGNVTVRFRQTLIEADTVQVNINTRQAVALGNVSLTRGDQVVRGNRMEYNLAAQTGTLFEARGVVLTSSTGSDFAVTEPTELAPGVLPNAPISDRITAAQPVGQLQTGTGADVEFSGFSLPNVAGNVNRLRFEAERIDIMSNGEWQATNVRITNDPFSPPEFELRADVAELNRISEFQDELITRNSRLVFDQNFTLPLFRERTVIDRRQREPSPFSIGYDLDELDGYYVQWNVSPVSVGSFELDVSPQFLVQRAFQDNLSPLDERFYGLRTDLSGRITPTTLFEAKLLISDFENFPNLDEDAYRTSLRLQQQYKGYTLTGQYSYRDRLFNGTLGFQRVRSSLGAVLTSPEYKLGNSDATFSFQASYQNIDARTDRLDLLEIDRDNDRINRDRLQAFATLSYPVFLWQGEALPPTPEAGLRYTPRPIAPFLRLFGVARGVTSFYGEDDSQSYLSATVGLQGQFGHFSKDVFDYTGFSIAYTQIALDGQSPFLFDRRADQRILSLALIQQIYGGLRAGVESAINLDNGLAVDNQFTLEYSRRTYGLLLRINPVRRVGSLNLRISDFNWTGGSEPF
ncbi:MAG: DUF3769 domain-containing protein [Microcoleaceae cyanobacterium]